MMRSLFMLQVFLFIHAAASQTTTLFVKNESSGFCSKTGHGAGEWILKNEYPTREVTVTLRYSVLNGGAATTSVLVQHLGNGETKSLGCSRMITGDRKFEILKVEFVGVEAQNGSNAP